MVDYAQGSGKQYHIGVGPEDIGEYVLLPGDPGRCESIASYFDNPKLVGNNREYVTYTGTLLGQRISVMSTGIGGSSAAIGLEELVHCGAHTFIRVGTCGGMQRDIVGGDIIIPTGAIRMEGTSREYTPIEFPAVPDFELTRRLVDSAIELNASYHTGVTQSKDSFYGQHEPEAKPVGLELLYKWNAWISAGCLGSEMENAALFIVGTYLKVRVASVLLVIANQEREKLHLPNPQVHDMDIPIKVSVNAIQKMIRDDMEK